MYNGMIFDNAKDFINDLAYVEINGKWGIINTQGELVVDFVYENLNCQQGENTCTAKLNGKCGILDTDENIVIPFEYEKYFILKNNLLIANKNGLWGAIDLNNDIIIPFRYKQMSFWPENNFCVETRGGK